MNQLRNLGSRHLSVATLIVVCLVASTSPALSVGSGTCSLLKKNAQRITEDYLEQSPLTKNGGIVGASSFLTVISSGTYFPDKSYSAAATKLESAVRANLPRAGSVGKNNWSRKPAVKNAYENLMKVAKKLKC